MSFTLIHSFITLDYTFAQGPRFLGAPKLNNVSKNVSEITLKDTHREKFYVINVLDKNLFNSQENGAEFKTVAKLNCL